MLADVSINSLASPLFMVNMCSRFLGLAKGQRQRHFGSDQSVWREGDWSGFVRIAVAGLFVLCEICAGGSEICYNTACLIGVLRGKVSRC